jgi:hypothetical protein
MGRSSSHKVHPSGPDGPARQGHARQILCISVTALLLSKLFLAKNYFPDLFLLWRLAARGCCARESPGALNAGQAWIQNAGITSNLDDDGPSGRVRIFGMNAEKFNPLIHSAVRRSKIQYHDPVLVVLDEVGERRHHFHAAFAGQIAAENRIVDRLPEALHGLVDLLQSSLLHDVVAYNIAIPSAQSYHFL